MFNLLTKDRVTIEILLLMTTQLRQDSNANTYLDPHSLAVWISLCSVLMEKLQNATHQQWLAHLDSKWMTQGIRWLFALHRDPVFGELSPVTGSLVWQCHKCSFDSQNDWPSWEGAVSATIVYHWKAGTEPTYVMSKCNRPYVLLSIQTEYGKKMNTLYFLLTHPAYVLLLPFVDTFLEDWFWISFPSLFISKSPLITPVPSTSYLTE